MLSSKFKLKNVKRLIVVIFLFGMIGMAACNAFNGDATQLSNAVSSASVSNTPPEGFNTQLLATDKVIDIFFDKAADGPHVCGRLPADGILFIPPEDVVGRFEAEFQLAVCGLEEDAAQYILCYQDECDDRQKGEMQVVDPRGEGWGVASARLNTRNSPGEYGFKLQNRSGSIGLGYVPATLAWSGCLTCIDAIAWPPHETIIADTPFAGQGSNGLIMHGFQSDEEIIILEYLISNEGDGEYIYQFSSSREAQVDSDGTLSLKMSDPETDGTRQFIIYGRQSGEVPAFTGRHLEYSSVSKK